MKADALPNPLLNMPFKVKEFRLTSKLETSRQLSNMQADEQPKKSSMSGFRKQKVVLIDQLETPTIKNEIHPMGSTFTDTEPNKGVIVMESGKVKYGS